MRGPWLEHTPEREYKKAVEVLRLSREGTIDSHVLAMRILRKTQTSQVRGSSHEGLVVTKKRFC